MKSQKVEATCATVPITPSNLIGWLKIVIEGGLPVLSYGGTVYDCFNFEASSNCPSGCGAYCETGAGNVYEVKYRINGGSWNIAPYNQGGYYPIPLPIPSTPGPTNTCDVDVKELSTGIEHDPKIFITRKGTE